MTSEQMINLGQFTFEEVFPFVTNGKSRKEYKVGENIYNVKMNSDRYHLFKINPNCCVCGLKGTKLILCLNPDAPPPHFNLYAEEDNKLVLMTKDHILPKCRGGKDSISNFRTCCSICNSLKEHYDLTNEQILNLRHTLISNPHKISSESLHKLLYLKKIIMSNINKYPELSNIFSSII